MHTTPLSKTFKSHTFPYPLGIAGGVVKTVEQAEKFLAADIPFEWGSFTSVRSLGNGGRDYYAHHVDGQLCYTLNSIGLTNPGMAYAEAHARTLTARARDNGRTFWVNVSGHSVDDTVELVARAQSAGYRLITVNGSCPNRGDEKKKRAAPILCYDHDAVSELFSRLDGVVADTSTLLLWKVSNGIPRQTLMHNIEAVAASRVFSGIITGNTVPDGYAILPNGSSAIMTSNGLTRGGMGGPAVMPLALSATELAAAAFKGKEKIVIGTGGVQTAHDVNTFLHCGAFFTQMNSAFREAYEDPSFVTDIYQTLMGG